MPAPSRVLVTFPGKLGDAIFSAPAMRKLASIHRTPVSLLLSLNCVPLERLFRAQTFIADVTFSADYVAEHMLWGVQPWCMPVSDPEHWDHIYHLGLRCEPLPECHLSDFIAGAYGLGPLNLEEASITLPGDPGPERRRSRKVVVHAFAGKMRSNPVRALLIGNYVRRAISRYPGLRVTLIAADSDAKDFYSACGLARLSQIEDIVNPEDLFEAARLIASAHLFVGVNSCCAALANALRTPSVVILNTGDWRWGGVGAGQGNIPIRELSPESLQQAIGDALSYPVNSPRMRTSAEPAHTIST